MDNNYENDKSYLDLISNIEKVQVKYAPEKADECKEAVLRAGELIHDFCYYEYGGGADFSDLHNVSLAYTTYTDEEKELQVTADLIDSKVTAAGATYAYELTLQSLIVDAAGTVCGARFLSKDGAYEDVKAGTIVIATGGYISNQEWVTTYAPEIADLGNVSVGCNSPSGVRP